MKYSQIITQGIIECLGAQSLPLVEFVLSKPAEGFGDYSTNVSFLVAKKVKKNPIVIGEALRNHLLKRIGSIVEKIEVKGGYINFFLSSDALKSIGQEALSKGPHFYSNFVKEKRLHIVEFSSPNIAKPFTIGHLRSTIIGDAVARILAHAGYKVIKDNHLGDWGTQFGKMIVAIKKWGNEAELSLSTEPVKDLVKLYVKFHEESETVPDLQTAQDDATVPNKPLEDEAREWFTKLEQGDPEARRIWKKSVDLSLTEFSKIYQRLDVHFDTLWGESHFENKMAIVLEELKAKGLVRESEGALVAFFDEELKLPPLMVLKKDGGTLYATRDLATDRYRKEFYGSDIVIINEVGKEQALYFKQIFKLEELLGYFPQDQRVHVMHGHYRFIDSKMSTRKGNVIWLNDVLDEAVRRAKTLCSDEGTEADAEKIGIGAIKFYDLCRSSEDDIVFSWENMLNMKGDTGPYVQYTAVRINSLVAKAEKMGLSLPDNIVSLELKSDEFPIIKAIDGFGEAVEKAASNYAPHHLAGYLISLCREYNSYYAKHNVVQESNVAGLFVSKAVVNVLTLGLGLLGIGVPSKM